MKTLNKLLIFIVLVLIGLAITGCENDDPDKDKNKDMDKVFYRIDFTTDLIQNEKVEMALYEKELKIAEGGNPYDTSYMKVYASITSPSGSVIEVPAFWYQDYSINFNTNVNIQPTGISGVASTNPDEPQGQEVISAVGDPHFRVRFTPTEVGKYKVVFKVYKYGTLISTENEKEFNVEKGTKEYKGVLEVDTTNNRTFRFSETLETFVTVGQNTCWFTSSTRKTEDYGVWFSNMAENDMNTTRIWMGPWSFCLHWNKSYDNFDKAYAAAARLDKMVDYAEEYNIYFMIALLNHGQFSSLVNPQWENNPYNSANGGPCDNPFEFFIKDDVKEIYKNELYYIVARYGYSSNVLCWELCNETDWIDGYSMYSAKFKTWAKEMSSYLKEIDPYHHMVSTSYKGTDGNGFSLDTIDFSSPHEYAYTNKNLYSNVVKTQENLASKYDKPVFYGEIGLNGENGYNNYQQDPNGVSLHQAMWAGIMGGAAGGAMNWWWDSYVHPYDLYHCFKGAGVFAKLLDLSGSDYSLLNGVAVSNNSNINCIGYKFNDRIYGYVYDKAWTHNNTNMANKANVCITIPFNNGTYTLTIYDTETGTAIGSSSVNVTNGTLTVNLGNVLYDLAFIVK